MKQEQVADVADKLQRAQSVVLVDYRGLTVEEVSNLRTKFREAGVEYKVIKNNMLKRAADSLEIEGLDDYFKGPTAAAFGFDDPVAPAKIMANFIKETKKTELKGGILSGKAVSADAINNLAKLPSKEELLAKMLGSLNAPVSNFVGVLSAIPRSLVQVLNAVREQKEA